MLPPNPPVPSYACYSNALRLPLLLSLQEELVVYAPVKQANPCSQYHYWMFPSRIWIVEWVSAMGPSKKWNDLKLTCSTRRKSSSSSSSRRRRRRGDFLSFPSCISRHQRGYLCPIVHCMFNSSRRGDNSALCVGA
mmetsp:Transcript_298/g.403  ORF Transcript_298/g.403 Transcript_298/m.403 type:complete len:136 (+) Transcript_298:3445-3852(+)